MADCGCVIKYSQYQMGSMHFMLSVMINSPHSILNSDTSQLSLGRRVHVHFFQNKKFVLCATREFIISFDSCRIFKTQCTRTTTVAGLLKLKVSVIVQACQAENCFVVLLSLPVRLFIKYITSPTGKPKKTHLLRQHILQIFTFKT